MQFLSQPSGFDHAMGFAALSGAATLDASHHGKLITLTAGGDYTLAFASAATLGAGWWCHIQNQQAATDIPVITLDPNGTQTIGGQTTRLCLPGERVLVWSDGANLQLMVEQPFRIKLDASWSFPWPAGYRGRYFKLNAGGGSGGKGGTESTGSATGGGGGACNEGIDDAPAAGTSVSVTVGGAASGVATASNGVVGNPTSISSGSVTHSAYGGGAGQFSATLANANGAGGGGIFGPGGGTNAVGGGAAHHGGRPGPNNSSSSFTAGDGQFGGGWAGATLGTGGGVYGGGASLSTASTTLDTQISGRSIHGGGGGGSAVANAGALTATLPGPSTLAGAGGAAGTSTSGADGAWPGGGGGATLTGAKSGDGAAGRAIISGVI